ncbi:hypothetical protein CONLIGDRAFT_650003 [Coniochaeta ligniaria NRRL 30616]|uniref:Uncharacterized protein n=1 Tax=Coniochaeta ligniaria NRRL 30616 TaxID=1408157 RepID=A0A1J7I6S5_9PEZI|nr:hypothetical protein CONLIGDRAFT_650003 [Coniochaeta ligniaria NRRL 30616]
MPRKLAFEAPIEAPIKCHIKQTLTMGKIALVNLKDDSAFLQAMKTEEDDTVTPYKCASRHKDAIPQSKAIMKVHDATARVRKRLSYLCDLGKGREDTLLRITTHLLTSARRCPLEPLLCRSG